MPAWLSRRHRLHQDRSSEPPETLGILAFEAGRAMARLVSLYRALSDAGIRRLRAELKASEGVARLTSGDEGRLLLFACSELVGELDAAAETAARLSRRCTNPCLVRFDLVYADVKLGVLHPKTLGLEFGSSGVDRVVDRMDRLARSTAALHSAMHSLSLKRVGRSGSGPTQEKIGFVEALRGASLWAATPDECVALMARAVCVVYVRACAVFAPLVSAAAAGTCSPTRPRTAEPSCLLEDRQFHVRNRRWAASRPGGAAVMERIARWEAGRMAGPETVGGAGMAARYAAIVAAAEGCLMCSPDGAVSDDARAGLYEMLPAGLRRRVAAEIRRGGGGGGERSAVEETLAWLGPVAHDTLTWQAERNLERQRGGFEHNPASVLLAQTLYFSDLEKTEDAIVHVLVGLSHILRPRKHERCN